MVVKFFSKLVSLFSLKYLKYPFCAPIVHPISETQSYTCTYWETFEIFWRMMTTDLIGLVITMMFVEQPKLHNIC